MARPLDCAGLPDAALVAEPTPANATVTAGSGTARCGIQHSVVRLL